MSVLPVLTYTLVPSEDTPPGVQMPAHRKLTWSPHQTHGEFLGSQHHLHDLYASPSKVCLSVSPSAYDACSVVLPEQRLIMSASLEHV